MTTIVPRAVAYDALSLPILVFDISFHFSFFLQIERNLSFNRQSTTKAENLKREKSLRWEPIPPRLRLLLRSPKQQPRRLMQMQILRMQRIRNHLKILTVQIMYLIDGSVYAQYLDSKAEWTVEEGAEGGEDGEEDGYGLEDCHFLFFIGLLYLIGEVLLQMKRRRTKELNCTRVGLMFMYVWRIGAAAPKCGV